MRFLVLASFVFLTSVGPLPAQSSPRPAPNRPPEATLLPNGVAWVSLVEGDGADHPRENDVVKIRYVVWDGDGNQIDAVQEPRAVLLAVPSMIPGWREGMLEMIEGETRQFWIPESLASQGKTRRPGGLVIEAELLEILRVPDPPEHLTTPPADALHTPSGLASIVLKDGSGTVHPKRSSRVVVHYTGWTSDGTMFDSSIPRGSPVELALREVIAGWREGLQLMVEGEIRRFWIPAKLAYARDPSKPQGLLTFEVELIAIR